jgi:hypothetical protein
MQVGQCTPVGVQLQKAGVGPTSGPTYRLSHLIERGEVDDGDDDDDGDGEAHEEDDDDESEIVPDDVEDDDDDEEGDAEDDNDDDGHEIVPALRDGTVEVSCPDWIRP